MCPQSVKKNENEVHLGLRRTELGVLGNCGISIAVTYTVLFEWAVLSARHGPRSKVWPCYSWQGDDWRWSSCVVTFSSPSLLQLVMEQRMILLVWVSFISHNTSRLTSTHRDLPVTKRTMPLVKPLWHTYWTPLVQCEHKWYLKRSWGKF